MNCSTFTIASSTCYDVAFGQEQDRFQNIGLCLHFIGLYRWESGNAIAIEAEKSSLAYPSRSMRGWKQLRMNWDCWPDSMGKHSSLHRSWYSKQTTLLFLNVELDALQQDVQLLIYFMIRYVLCESWVPKSILFSIRFVYRVGSTNVRATSAGLLRYWPPSQSQGLSPILYVYTYVYCLY